MNSPAVRGFSITEEDSITNDVPKSTYPTFYELCKQCWTIYETCKEYQYYDCIEGECGERGTHNNSAQSRKTWSMMIEKVPGDVNVGIGTVSGSEMFNDDDNMGIRMRSAYEFVNVYYPRGDIWVMV